MPRPWGSIVSVNILTVGGGNNEVALIVIMKEKQQDSAVGWIQRQKNIIAE